MSIKEKKKRKIKCYADLVSNVPTLIKHPKYDDAYERLHFIGQGSYGKCYEVVKKLTKERFACKILSMDMTQDADFLRLIQDEISIHRKLRQHPHVVQLIQSFNDGTFVYMIQELCSNHSLRDLQKTRGTVSVDECRYFISQILHGAQYIHDSGVIHRDLKLSNVLIDKNMQMKICDFGLAIRTDNPRLASRSLCGTTNYLAPEVIMRKGFQRRSDVWAIGVICYVLLYGYKPFEECDAYATHKRIVKADYKLSSGTSNEIRSFFKNVFNRDVYLRLNAGQCLELDFFKRHTIPKALPLQTLTQMSFSETVQPSSCNFINECNFSVYSTVVDKKDITYQEIRVQMSPIIPKSFANMKQARIMEDVFEQFNNICLYHTPHDRNLSEISDLDEFIPDYWVSRWSIDRKTSSGFAYEMCDGSRGMVFHQGSRLMRTPDECLWVHEICDESFREVKDEFEAAILNDQITKFDELETALMRNGLSKVETAYSQSKQVFVHTWLYTDQAMVLLLNNHTIQINFIQGHKKILISPVERKMTFITNRMEPQNFKTLSFDVIAKHGFSYLSFIMFKYVTAIVQHLAHKLKQA